MSLPKYLFGANRILYSFSQIFCGSFLCGLSLFLYFLKEFNERNLQSDKITTPLFERKFIIIEIFFSIYLPYYKLGEIELKMIEYQIQINWYIYFRVYH